MEMSDPFEMGWFTAGSSDIWNCQSTYCFITYDSLPKIEHDLLQGNFHWLTDLQGDETCMAQDDISSAKLEQHMLNNLTQLLFSCREKKIELPESFCLFFQNTSLYSNIPSCTACYFDLSNSLLSCPGDDEAYLIRFMNDQQGVLLWYLYIHPQHPARVVVASPEWKDEDENITQLDDAVILKDLIKCAESFEEFIYRFWIENKIWFALYEERPLNKEQQEYMLAAKIESPAD